MSAFLSQHSDVTPYSRALLFLEYLQIHSVTDSYYELFVNTQTQKNTRETESAFVVRQRIQREEDTHLLLYIYIIHHTLYVEIGIPKGR